jgi:hypothetical protein
MYHPEGSFMTKDLAKESAMQQALVIIDKE